MIGRFLSGYSESFFMAVALWPVASLSLTLPLLAYLYHRDGRLRPASVVATYLSVLYLLGLACFTLYPLPQGGSGPGITYGVPWQLDPLAFVDDFRREGVSTIPQIAFNVVLFTPLGFISGRLLRRGPLASLLLGCAVSLLIEGAQGTGLFGLYPFAYRTADVDDVLYNAVGAASGWSIARLSLRVVPEGALAREGDVTRAPGFVRRCVALWLDLIIAVSVALVSMGAMALASRAVPGGDATLDDRWALVLSVASFIAVEAVYPWTHGGSTPGGRFVRMSFETRERTGARRVAFYIARLATLGAVCLIVPLAALPAALFYLIVRQMPYDFI